MGQAYLDELDWYFKWSPKKQNRFNIKLFLGMQNKLVNLSDNE
jgi:hypothetical protein